MTNVVDPKAYWDLPETIWWICTRDEQWVTDMQDMSEEDKAALALFGIRPMTVVQPLKPPPPEIIAALQMMLAKAALCDRAGRRNRWFIDSPLEGDGFELPVRRERRYRDLTFCASSMSRRTRATAAPAKPRPSAASTIRRSKRPESRPIGTWNASPPST